jgi:glyoxylase-like metal-dependent hydrolase (beta-lactamase superfamily II)
MFHEDVGRTDLPGGDEAALRASIAKLLKLPEDTIVYPGHEELSSIKHERVANPMKD